MIKTHLRFNLAYALIFILVLVSGYKQWPTIVYMAKPCITLLLLIFISYSSRLKGRFSKRLFTGLVFALAGDTLMLMNGSASSLFTWGIVCMLICHLFYIGAFYLDFRSAQELDKKGARIAIICSAIIFTALYLYLRPHVGALKLPVLFSIFTMALLVMMASFRNQRVNASSFRLILAGVFFLVISDVLLAEAWLIDFSYLLWLLIAGTYMIAQYLIIVGGAERKLIHTATPV